MQSLLKAETKQIVGCFASPNFCYFNPLIANQVMGAAKESIISLLKRLETHNLANLYSAVDSFIVKSKSAEETALKCENFLKENNFLTLKYKFFKYSIFLQNNNYILFNNSEDVVLKGFSDNVFFKRKIVELANLLINAEYTKYCLKKVETRDLFFELDPFEISFIKKSGFEEEVHHFNENIKYPDLPIAKNESFNLVYGFERNYVFRDVLGPTDLSDIDHQKHWDILFEKYLKTIESIFKNYRKSF
jgi:hypothetical protein